MWSSKKQPVIAFLSCESEYIALACASHKAVYLSDLLSESTFPLFSSVQIDVRGQHGSSPAIRYYIILAKDQTHLYVVSFSEQAGCIEQDARISCQDNRAACGQFHQFLRLPEV